MPLSPNATPEPSPPPIPLGRLVLIMERELHPKSRDKLKHLLHMLARQPEPTFVASLAQPSLLGALRLDDGHVFYNFDSHAKDLPQTLGYLPWREVWVVNNGRLWCGMHAL